MFLCEKKCVVEEEKAVAKEQYTLDHVLCKEDMRFLKERTTGHTL